MSDRLLYAITVKGGMKIDQFNSIFSSMTASNFKMTESRFQADVRQRAVRLLDSLGHCEFDFDSRKVWVCPPAFVPLTSSGLPKYVLVGARTPELVKKLKRSVAKNGGQASLHIHSMSSGGIDLPSHISVEAATNEIVEEIAKNTSIDFQKGDPAAWRMVHCSASLEDIRQSTKFQERTAPNWFSRVFSTNDLLFVSSDAVEGGSMQLVAYKSPVDQQMRHWIWNGKESGDVDRDWGRYWALSATGHFVLIYDKKRNRFAVPVSVPLPCLLARALTLCSGIAPSIAELWINNYEPSLGRRPVHLYEEVTPIIAEAVCGKVGQKIIGGNLEPDDEGILSA